MKQRWVKALTVSSIVGSGTDAGAYFAFSTFVMRGLDRLPVASKVTAMQWIDAYAENAWFAIALFGTGVTSAVLGVLAARGRVDRRLGWAAGLYVVSLAVTFGANVPLNNMLARVTPGSREAGEAWSRFLGPWMAWNHLRLVTALAATGLFAWAQSARGEER